LDRRERVLAGLDLGGLGLEIGGGPWPLVASDPALTVRSLDYLDREGLIAKYEAMGVDPSGVRPIDYVWSGERYLDLVGDTRFDWIVASHVIEHVPDLLGFMNQCAEILKPGGTLTLIVPDRRCAFDYFRMPAGLGAVIDAHLEGRRRSSPGTTAEFALYMAELDGREIWNADDRGRLAFRHPSWLARALYDRAAAGEHSDIHAWVFTPNSFRLIVEDLHLLGLGRLRERSFHAPDTHEFFIQLSPDGAGPGVERLELCRLALDDLRRPAPDAEPVVEPAVLEDAGAAAAAEAEAERLRQEIEAIHGSKSWRLTEPLRAARRAASRLRS
jgi:SAM-dependent methyltransferase